MRAGWPSTRPPRTGVTRGWRRSAGSATSTAPWKCGASRATTSRCCSTRTWRCSRRPWTWTSARPRRRLAPDQPQHLVALLLHVLRGDERLEVQAQERLRVRGAHVEVPVLVIDRDAVELRHLAVRVALLELAHLPLGIRHLGVDLAGDEVLRAEGGEQLAHALALLRQELEDQQRRDRAGVGAVEVAEVVVARHLAAERRALLAHGHLEEGVPAAIDQRGAASVRGQVAHRTRGAPVVEDLRARLFLEHR